jgi:hypothetical protein
MLVVIELQIIDGVRDELDEHNDRQNVEELPDAPYLSFELPRFSVLALSEY